MQHLTATQVRDVMRGRAHPVQGPSGWVSGQIRACAPLAELSARSPDGDLLAHAQDTTIRCHPSLSTGGVRVGLFLQTPEMTDARRSGAWRPSASRLT